MKEIHASAFEEGTAKFKIDREPDECPICHSNIRPRTLDVSVFQSKDPTIDAVSGPCRLYIVYWCPNSKCGRLFISTYHVPAHGHQAHLLSSAPKKMKPPNIPEVVEEVSPKFADIYKQSLEADAKNLTQLVGAGLRKAVEFLVKDYLIDRNPEEEDKYKRTHLRSCIKDHIDNKQLKRAANNAVLLGHDEVHYEKDYKDKDIEDLKTLVRVAMHWVENSLLTEGYAEEMEDAEATSAN
jgi:hypothetical protein